MSQVPHTEADSAVEAEHVREGSVEDVEGRWEDRYVDDLMEEGARKNRERFDLEGPRSDKDVLDCF